MAQVGRISGPLLTANLERQGKDLDFRDAQASTPLLKLKVGTNKIGVNTTSPAFELDIVNTLAGNFLSTSSLSPGNFTISNNDINVLTGNINFKSDVTSSGIATQQLMLRDNTISSYVTNSDINLLPNGTGTIELQANTNVTGNLNATGDITLDGNVIFGNEDSDSVTLNADVASNIIPDANNTYNLGSALKDWDEINFGTMEVQTVLGNSISLENGLIDFTERQGNIFYVDKNGSDSNVGDHPNGAFLTIKHALSFADASIQGPVVIHIAAGEYEEVFPLTVPVNVTVTGEDMRNTIIKPTVATNTNNCFELNGETTIENLTIKGFFSSGNPPFAHTGYAFCFASNAIITSRSPYIRNVTVSTKGSVSYANDANGYTEGDAGRGAIINGFTVSDSSEEASMLFHSCTFITHGVEAIHITNGARVEWLNSFIYFASRGIFIRQGNDGHLSTDGSTRKYGGELRAIGSANVYGDEGIRVAGSETLAYLVNHNFSYMGTLRSEYGLENDPTLTDHTKEVIELSSGKAYRTSVDELGNYRVGTALFVNQDTGKTEIEAARIDFSNTDSLTVSTAGNTVFIDDTQVRNDFIRLRSNKLESLVSNLKIDSALNNININADTNITGNLNTDGNATITGAMVTLGDADTDNIAFTADITSGMIPNVHSSFDLGSSSKMWQTAYAEKLRTDEIDIEGNNITTTSSDADLDLDPAGTGKVLTNKFIADKPYIQTSTTSVETVQNNSTLNITGTLTANSDSTFNNVVTSKIQVDGYANFGSTGFVGNKITTRDSDANLVFQPSGTGKMKILKGVFVQNTIFAPTTNYSFTSASMQNTSGDTLVTQNYNTQQQIVGDVRFEGNVIDTMTSNTDLDFRANGTGKVILQENVEVKQDISVNTIQGVAPNISAQDLTADFATVNQAFTGPAATIGSVRLGGNLIETVDSNANLELGANGTGKVVLDENVTIPNINVDGLTNIRVSTAPTATFNNVAITNNVTAPTTVTIEDIQLIGNTVQTITSNANLDLRASGTGNINLKDNVIIKKDITADSLTFEQLDIASSNLLNLDVTNLKIIANTEVVVGDISIAGNVIETYTSNVDLDLRAHNTGKVRLQDNTVVAKDLTVSGKLTAHNIGIAGDVDLNELETDGNIEFNDNYVTTTVSNSNLELRTSGGAFIDLQGLKVKDDVVQSSTSADIILDPVTNLKIDTTDSIVLPKSLTDSTNTFSNNIGAVQYNSDINNIVGLSNSTRKVLGAGLFSDDLQTSVDPRPGNIIKFTAQSVNSMTTSYGATTMNRIELSGIDIDGNTLSTNITNSDLILAPEIGQGKVQIENLHVLDNTFTANTDNAYNIAVTGDGYVKFNQTSSWVIPVGNSANRPPDAETEIGMTRWNVALSYLEVYTAGGWTDASGSGATVSAAEMDEIMNEFILIFG